MIWLGDDRGCLTDWLTQMWVIATGRRVAPDELPWLDGPVGKTRRIGGDFFVNFAADTGAKIEPGNGLLRSIDALKSEAVETKSINSLVREFYENTSGYAIESWSEWSGWFAPFGRLLFWVFSKRLQQLNVPQHPLDTALGMESYISHLYDGASGSFLFASWVRRLVATGNIIYAGAYSIVRVPGHTDPCVKVVFPLPNGNAIVIMQAQVTQENGLRLISAGKRFGDPGFYFTVRRNRIVRARYVRAMQETIHVYPGKDGICRADHNLRFFGRPFLRLHYALRPLLVRNQPG